MRTLLTIFALAMLVTAGPASAYPGESKCSSGDDCFIISAQDSCGRNTSACFNRNDDMDSFREFIAEPPKGKKKVNCKAKAKTIPDCYCSPSKKCVPAKRAIMH